MPAHSSLRHPKKTLLKASSFDVLRQLNFDTEDMFSPGMKQLVSSLPQSELLNRYRHEQFAEPGYCVSTLNTLTFPLKIRSSLSNENKQPQTACFVRQSG
jgi:hypothetical protein